jgi:hypothetical protein
VEVTSMTPWGDYRAKLTDIPKLLGETDQELDSL